MTIALDTPEEINMWVLLSRRHQIQLHLKGLKVKGIMDALRKIPGCEGARRAKDCIVPVEYAISQAGGEIDYRLVNVHVMRRMVNGLFSDAGIYSDMSQVESQPNLVALYQMGRLEIVLTLEDPRGPNGQSYLPA